MTIQLPDQVQSVLSDPASYATPLQPQPLNVSATPPDAVTGALGGDDLGNLPIATGSAAKNQPTLFGQRLAAALDKTPIQLKPNGQPQPGAWARSIIGGWQQALAGDQANTSQPTTPPPAPPSRASRIINALSGSIGDAAAASEKVPPGGGALTGITRTLQARGQRLSEEQKTRAQMALSNAQMIHEQALTHQIGDNAINASVAQGKDAVKAITEAPQPGRTIADGKTSDDLQSMIANKEIDPSTMTVYPTGRVQTGEDKNGLPIFRTTYTVVEPGGPVTLDAGQAAFLSKGTGQEIKEGQVLPAVDYNSLYQQASNNQAATLARDELASKMKVAEANREQIDFSGSDVWNNALRQAGYTNPDIALKNLQANPQIAQKYPNLYNDVRKSYGQELWDKVIEERQKQDVTLADKTEETMHKLETDPSEYTGEKVAGTKAVIQGMLANPTTSPANKVRLTRLLDQADNATKYNAKFEADKEAAKTAIAEGDPRKAALLLANDNADPDQLLSNRRPQFVADTLDYLHKIDPGYKAGEERNMYKIAASPQQAVFFGSANSLLKTGGNVDKLIAAHQALGNKKLPVFNTVKDWLDFQAGHPELGAYLQTVVGTADDYAKVVGGGVATDTGRQEEERLLANRLNNEQVSAVGDAIKSTVGSQVRERIGQNHVLGSFYGYALPPEVMAPPDTIGHKIVNGRTIYQLKNGSVVNWQGRPVDPNTGERVLSAAPKQ